jgi:uncharacterized OsmC-like protein
VSQVRMEQKQMVNGLDVGRLQNLVQMLKKQRQAGQMTLIAQTQWKEGGASTTLFDGYEIDGAMQHTVARDLRIEADEPIELGGTDRAPSPPETLLHALGSCVAATINSYAAMLGVRLTHLNIALEGDLDLHGKFALGKNVRPGFNRIYMRISIDGDADEKTLRDVAAAGFKYSIVQDTLAGGVEIVPQVEMFG